MSNLIGVRLNKDDHVEYLRIVKEVGTNPSAMTAKIVHDWLRFHRTKQYRGDITLSVEILKKRHEAIKKGEIDKIVKHNSRVIISEMEFQVDNLDFAEISRRILEWNRENGMAMIMRDRKDNTVFMQKHSLGVIWSEIQCKMYCKMFEMVGETIRSMRYDSSSLSFEVIRQN
jgi:hypothetical protein